MGAIERFFYGEHGASRSYVLSKAILALLTCDIWLLMVSHAGRYGAGGFNVSHFAWLDAIQPMPSAGSYVVVLVLAGFLTTVMLFTGVRLAPALALFALYTYGWAMSMIDSFQHHYFISIILLCLAFFPRTAAPEVAQELRSEQPRGVFARPGWGFTLLGVNVAILYVFTAVAKMEEQWLAGHMLSLAGSEPSFRILVEAATRAGISSERVLPLLARIAVVQELAIAACYLVSVSQHSTRHRLHRTVGIIGLIMALTLHAGTEAMGLQIGLFSYYMMALAGCYFLPIGAVDRIALLLAVPATWVRYMTDRLQLRGWAAAWTSAGLAAIAAAALLLAGRHIDLPGVLTACAIATAVLVIGATWGQLLRRYDAVTRYSVAAAVAAAGMWFAIMNSTVRWDYYRYVGGDLMRRGEPAEALRAYEHAERYAPPGASRSAEIGLLLQQLGR